MPVMNRAALWLLLLCTSFGCASLQPDCASTELAPFHATDALDSVLFVIGDAGGPPDESERVLDQLQKEARAVVAAIGKERTTIVFAGDNIYPSGLPDVNDPARADAETRLNAQIRVAESGAAVRFVAGNHDWNRGHRGGLAAVRRQHEYIANVAKESGVDVAMLPQGGCPGPAVIDIGSNLRLLFIDSQFWLHTADDLDGNQCSPAKKDAAVAAIREQIRTSRNVVLLAHHPLRTGGPHGGYFSIRQHVFPLTELHRSLYVPLPLIGSLYPLARWMGISSQDVHSRRYAALIRDMREATRGSSVIWAAGHEHNLQRIDGGDDFPLVVVSGNGMLRHASPLRRLRGMRACSTRPGYVRIDVPRAGEAAINLMVLP